MEQSKIMLDTSAYSAFLRGNGSVIAAVRAADEIYVNPIVVGELYAGFAHGGREKKNREILREFLASARVRIAIIDEQTSERYAAIISFLWEKGAPLPTNDLWIAATAMQYGLKLVTTDNHYRQVPQIIVACCDI